MKSLYIDRPVNEMAEQESAPNGFQVFLNNLLDFFGLCRPIDDSHENQRPGGETVSTQGFDRSTRSSEKPAGFQASSWFAVTTERLKRTSTVYISVLYA